MTTESSASRFFFFLRHYVFLPPFGVRIMAWKLSSRTTAREKRVGRCARNWFVASASVARCLLILVAGIGFPRERGDFGISAWAEGPIDSIEKTGWYTRECYYTGEETTGRHDSGHHSIESYIRSAVYMTIRPVDV